MQELARRVKEDDTESSDARGPESGDERFTFIYYAPSMVPIAFGMVNASGAMCWFNSLLQMMLSFPSLSDTLRKNRDKLQGNRFATEYIKLLDAILPNEPGYSPVNVSQVQAASPFILQAFREKLTAMTLKCPMGNGQECANEGYTFFIDALDCYEAKKLFHIAYEMSCYCSGCNQKIIQGATNKADRDLSYHIELFTNGVSLGPSEAATAHKDMFCRWIRARKGEVDTWKCAKCGHVNSEKDLDGDGRPIKQYRYEKLTTLREIVVILFNKYQRKDLRYFPPIMEFPSTNGKMFTYQLVCKVEHSGSYNMQTGASGGHYWVHALRNNNDAGADMRDISSSGLTFWNLNDSAASSGNLSPTENSIMIAYHIVHPDSVSGLKQKLGMM